MTRNEYRRSLIMLRSNAAGYSGHVRLERRTLMGSMYFIVQAPPTINDLRAALVGRNRNGYYACAIGVIRRDNRDQLNLGYSFEPHNICDRDLEDYQLIAVCLPEGENPDIVLSGNVNGHADVEWDRVRMAINELYLPNGSIDILPPSVPQNPPMAAPQNPPMPTPQNPPPTAPQNPPPTTPQNPPPEIPDEPTTLPLQEAEISAAEEGGVDPEAAWPEAVETLKPLFFESQAIKTPPDERFTYVSAPMPEGSGYKNCYAGIRCENGVPVEVSYALPSAYRPNPPAGMEDYHWVGDQNAGWWVIEQKL